MKLKTNPFVYFFLHVIPSALWTVAIALTGALAFGQREGNTIVVRNWDALAYVLYVFVLMVAVMTRVDVVLEQMGVGNDEQD